VWELVVGGPILRYLWLSISRPVCHAHAASLHGLPGPALSVVPVLGAVPMCRWLLLCKVLLEFAELSKYAPFAKAEALHCAMRSR
jgi:hypothetical protein